MKRNFTKLILLYLLLTNLAFSKEIDSLKSIATAQNVVQQEAEQFIIVLMKYSNIVNAANAHDFSSVALFLKNDANPNERGSIGAASYIWGDRRGQHIKINEGMTSLDIATNHSDLSMVTLLLEFGADANLLRKVEFDSRKVNKNIACEPYFGQFSPIYVAIKNKDYNLLRTFSEFGTDFNKICFTGYLIEQRPLDVAITDKDFEAAAILINGGAKP